MEIREREVRRRKVLSLLDRKFLEDFKREVEEHPTIEEIWITDAPCLWNTNPIFHYKPKEYPYLEEKFLVLEKMGLVHRLPTGTSGFDGRYLIDGELKKIILDSIRIRSETEEGL